MGDQHISFTTTKLGSLAQVTQSKDPEGLKLFYYLVQASLGFTAAALAQTLSHANAVTLFVELLHRYHWGLLF